MNPSDSNDVSLRDQKTARLLFFVFLIALALMAYDQWWRGTYLPKNTTMWACRLGDRSLIDPARFAVTSGESGICGASVAALGEHKRDIYVVVYQGNEFATSWQPRWIASNDPRTSAFETTVNVPGYLVPGQYRFVLQEGRQVLGEIEIELLDPRVAN